MIVWLQYQFDRAREHIVRNELDMDRIRTYVANHPATRTPSMRSSTTATRPPRARNPDFRRGGPVAAHGRHKARSAIRDEAT